MIPAFSFIQVFEKIKKWLMSSSSQPIIAEAAQISDQKIRSYFSCQVILKYVCLNWCISHINYSEKSYPSSHLLSHRYLICQHFFGFHSSSAASLVVLLSIGRGEWKLFTV